MSMGGRVHCGLMTTPLRLVADDSLAQEESATADGPNSEPTVA